MSNYEAVKPLNKTEDLVNRQSKKAPQCDQGPYQQILFSKTQTLGDSGAKGGREGLWRQQNADVA